MQNLYRKVDVFRKSRGGRTNDLKDPQSACQKHYQNNMPVKKKLLDNTSNGTCLRES